MRLYRQISSDSLGKGLETNLSQAASLDCLSQAGPGRAATTSALNPGEPSVGTGDKLR